MHQKAKYIPWVLGAILLVIVVVSVNELFKQQTVNRLLQQTNDRLSQDQIVSEEIILTYTDSLMIYDAIALELMNKRIKRKDTLDAIKKDHIRNRIIITDDGAVAHVSAIGDIFRQYDSSY